MRGLVTVTPQMYRQAIAFSLRRRRPGVVARTAAPEDAEGEIVTFLPHLLVHNDDDGLGLESTAKVLCRVTVLYSDGMDARISAGGKVSVERDMSTSDLLRVVDSASAMVEA